jgi:hypothetical protein
MSICGSTDDATAAAAAAIGNALTGTKITTTKNTNPSADQVEKPV